MIKQHSETLLGESDPLAERLNQRLKDLRRQRAEIRSKLGENEVEDIKKLDHRLFPVDFELDKQNTEELRAICSLSQSGLRHRLKITSHRPLLGPLIVFAKRILWRIVQVLLKETFEGTQEFNARLVKSHARALLSIHRLERQVSESQINASRLDMEPKKGHRSRSSPS